MIFDQVTHERHRLTAEQSLHNLIHGFANDRAWLASRGIDARSTIQL